jgi:hypothetical protein
MPGQDGSGIIDVILGVAALATVVALVRSWGPFWDADFTAADRRLATQVAIFLVPPGVVLLHELGHVAAVLTVGAEVVAFHYGLFEGSVTAGGDLTRSEHWFVALSGNVVGVLVGVAMAVTGVRATRMRRPLRHVLILGGVVTAAFTVVAYPLLSLSAAFGDWVVIYDFDRTPALSTATAVVHLVGVVALWRWWRATVRRTQFAVDHGAGGELDRLERAIAERPGDVALRLDLATLYLRHGDAGLARAALEEAAAACPASARIHLARARLAVIEGRWHNAVVAAEEGLRAPDADDDTTQRLWANLGLALASMERPANALAAFENVRAPVVDDARVRYGRGLARIGAGDHRGGRADLEAVVRVLPDGHLLRRWAEARLVGGTPSPPDDSGRPSYQRSSSAPPAPIAGV